MSRPSITQTVKSGKILISDGAWGTFLHKKGMKPGECPELWCVEHPEEVLDIAKGYIKVGSDMVETNSFGGSVFKLKHYGLSDRVGELNEAAARLSREAAGEDKWVIASVGPTGKILMMGDVTEEELYDGFKEQVIALEKGGADAVFIETMTAIDEATIAIKAAKENTKLEIISTFTFDKTIQGDYRTMMGVSPAEAAQAAIDSGADIVGTNCGNGLRNMIDIIKEIRRVAPETPILVHANAGAPQYINGANIFPETPEMMASLVMEVIEAGANIIGGCCGTTPEHIKAIREKLNNP